MSNEINKEELRPRMLPKVAPGEEIVISGLAGRFPGSDNVQQLKDNLMNKIDLITEDHSRWISDVPRICRRFGKINRIEKFDSIFFGVHVKQAHAMDPVNRMLLEHTYEAIVDAGINPAKLRGTKTGVFIGASWTETERTVLYDKDQINGFGIVGCSRSMLANRISYWLDIKGPSYTIDTACSSSLSALEQAYRSIKEGHCDAAIVGSGNLCLHPYITLQFLKLGLASSDGCCKSFDDAADGYVRSEAVSVIFLQKSKNAKRIYATLVHGKTNCDGFKEEGVTYPSSHMQSILFQEFYMELGLPPTIVDYIEAHGTGTKIGDPEEAKAIDKVFTPCRGTSLKIGTCKSNFGHTECVSGLSAVTKVIIAMESGIIPPNLHYKNPKKSIKGLTEGRLSVVTKPTLWKGGYMAINNFGYGGVNVHVLLKSHDKEKINNGAPNDSLPRLVTISGRTEEAVSTIINYLNSKPADVEYIKLLHDIYAENIKGHLFRGYTILPAFGVNKNSIQNIKPFSELKRPICYVFSGMGSQWCGMGKDLLSIPTFAEAIKKCDIFLKSRNLDIYQIITSRDEAIFDNVMNIYVGIAAIQIGLIEILRSLNIKPDYMIGHSVGELGCAYADGCFTAEEMILTAYSRGLASTEKKIIRGSMAAIGAGYEELKQICPPDVDIACNNSDNSQTISGPEQSVTTFIATLKAKNIFAKEVNCAHIPYHSRYITPLGQNFLNHLKNVILKPKPRSSKWLSTSVPIQEWDTSIAYYSSAEYHVNNLLKPVLFNQALNMLPKNAIIIEIAPHCLLQAIFRRSFDNNTIYIPLTQRNNTNNLKFLFESFGKMFIAGLQPQLTNLYPPVEYPVSRTTPMISPLIQWEHSDDWYVLSDKCETKNASCERTIKISTSDVNYEFMTGYIIDGKNLFPIAEYLFLVWELTGMIHNKSIAETPVVFDDVEILKNITLSKDKTIELTISIHSGTGRFEITRYTGAAVAKGRVRRTVNITSEKSYAPIIMNENEDFSMTFNDVYKELRLRGYHYTKMFSSITKSTIDGSKGYITWRNNWTTFIDNMIQMQILNESTRNLSLTTKIKKLVIDPIHHFNQIKYNDEDQELPVYVDKLYDVIICGGIEIRGLKTSSIVRRNAINNSVVLEEYKFFPYQDKTAINVPDIIRFVTHICIENDLDTDIKVIELVDRVENIFEWCLLSPLVSKVVDDLPLVQAEISICTNFEYKNNSLPNNVFVVDIKKVNTEPNNLLAIGHQLFQKNRLNNLNILLLQLKNGGFLLTREITKELNNIESIAERRNLNIILEKSYKDETFILLRKCEISLKKIGIVHVRNDNFNWLKDMNKAMSRTLDKNYDESSRILFVVQGEFENGLLGFINCLRKEPGGKVVRGLLIQDPFASKFSLQNPFYYKQIQKDLTLNVLRENGTWGTYRHFPLSPLRQIPVHHALVIQKVNGDLGSLSWYEGSIQLNIDNKNIIHITHSSINFRDLEIATGTFIPEITTNSRQLEDKTIGFEYSGINVLGKRVMGIITNQAMSNHCFADNNFIWEVPDDWTLEDAVTVPYVYSICYYALYKKGGIKKGDKILIHNGTEDVSQAAIYLALNEGCEVFTTVGSPEKRCFIRKHFPQIEESHIGESHDMNFEKMIIQQTNNKGVDIILNNLSEEKMQASINCLARGGRFFKIKNLSSTSFNAWSPECFQKEISLFGVTLDNLFLASDTDRSELNKFIAEGLKIGAIKPLARTVFLKNEVQTAFRYMTREKHIGKIILKISNEDEPFNSPIVAFPRYYCIQDHSYVILGGLGGFGLELANWLISRGAKYLVLTSRSGVKDGYQMKRLNMWKNRDIQVITIADKDASKEDDCLYILNTAINLAPIDGIFNVMGKLKDGAWYHQTPESFQDLMISKPLATHQLDKLSRKLCPSLRHFVVFSSYTSGRGHPGQTNYGMANSAMERICEKRVREGFPALAIQWSAVADVGMAAKRMKDNENINFGGTLMQKVYSCLETLDQFLLQKKTIVSNMIVAEKKIKNLIPKKELTSAIDIVLNVMGLKDLKGISLTTSFAELGMDSLMSMEIKQALDRKLKLSFDLKDLRLLNFEKLKEICSQHNNSIEKFPINEDNK